MCLDLRVDKVWKSQERQEDSDPMNQGWTDSRESLVESDNMYQEGIC